MAAAEAIPADLAWLDGRCVPRAELTVPVGDAGFVLGATVTEQLRTFHGRPFLVEEHLARLGESASIVGIELPMPVADVAAAAAHVAAHNHARAAAGTTLPGPDLGIVIFLTPGDLPAQHGGRGGRARMALHTFPLAFSMWAAAYKDGLTLRSVSVRQVPDTCWPLSAKVRSRLHYFLADREAHATEAGARAVLAHVDGRISETSTANVAVVRGGTIVTPPATDALAGVSLAYARRLATTLGITWREESLRTADLSAADEILLTSTPNCILPATRFDGRPVGGGRPGPVFHALLAAWSAAVGLDIAAQARSAAASDPISPATATRHLPGTSREP